MAIGRGVASAAPIGGASFSFRLARLPLGGISPFKPGSVPPCEKKYASRQIKSFYATWWRIRWIRVCLSSGGVISGSNVGVTAADRLRDIGKGEALFEPHGSWGTPRSVRWLREKIVLGLTVGVPPIPHALRKGWVCVCLLSRSSSVASLGFTLIG